jgi:biogenesis AIM24-like protein
MNILLRPQVTSTSPLTALLGINSPSTSISTINLDGRLDWVVAQRNGLLAWTGHALTVKPKINFPLSPFHWGNTLVTGRGLVAVVGRGQLYQMNLEEGDEYVVHPKYASQSQPLALN